MRLRRMRLAGNLIAEQCQKSLSVFPIQYMSGVADSHTAYATVYVQGL